jgi:hypothetical protein
VGVSKVPEIQNYSTFSFFHRKMRAGVLILVVGDLSEEIYFSDQKRKKM